MLQPWSAAALLYVNRGIVLLIVYLQIVVSMFNIMSAEVNDAI